MIGSEKTPGGAKNLPGEAKKKFAKLLPPPDQTPVYAPMVTDLFNIMKTELAKLSQSFRKLTFD